MNCERCGQLRVPGATFCTGCGSSLQAIQPVVNSIAEQSAGASCPYCHTALIASQTGATCPSCSALHHGECWTANGGCCTAGCSAGPVGKAVGAVATAGGQLTSGDRRSQILLFGLIAVAIVTVGISIAVLATSGDPPLLSETLAAPDTQPDTSAASVSPGASAATGRKRKKTGAGDPDSASDRVIKREIKLMMRRHYGAVDRGDWDRAYKSLSSRKRSQKRAEAISGGLANGVDKYRQQFQGELMGQLDMGAMRIDLEDVDPDAGEASFVLTIPKQNGGCYSGLTWAAYEGSRGWLFDIGSSGRPERPTSGTQVLQSRSAPC